MLMFLIWSFGEKLPAIEKGTNDPEDVGFSLETLAALVAQKFSYGAIKMQPGLTWYQAYAEQLRIGENLLVRLPTMIRNS
jgi:hypothetical protein